MMYGVPRAQVILFGTIVRGTDPVTEWRVAQAQEGRRVLWLNLVLYLHAANKPQIWATSPFQRFLRANLNRKRQIWPTDWYGLHCVRQT